MVAPSKLERPPGDRIKTDRRDAGGLARLLHIGEITGIRVPTVVEEDARDLFRARDDARVDLMRARHRLSKLLLRHGIVYTGGKAWTGVHERWLRSQRFELPGTRASFEEAFDAVLSTTARRDRLDEAIIAAVARPRWWCCRSTSTGLCCRATAAMIASSRRSLWRWSTGPDERLVERGPGAGRIQTVATAATVRARRSRPSRRYRRSLGAATVSNTGARARIRSTRASSRARNRSRASSSTTVGTRIPVISPMCSSGTALRHLADPS